MSEEESKDPVSDSTKHSQLVLAGLGLVLVALGVVIGLLVSPDVGRYEMQIRQGMGSQNKFSNEIYILDTQTGDFGYLLSENLFYDRSGGMFRFNRLEKLSPQ